MSAHVALLRGINVGGKNKLPMKELARMFSNAGCRGVQTFIQSGNVIFTASASVADGLAASISKEIESDFGLHVPVVLRSQAQLERAIADNPFLKEKAGEEFLHVAFLADPPKNAGKLDETRSPGDRFAVRGREIYLYLPNGVARSKLTNAYFDSKLGTVSTMRNWRTVLKLREMMA